MLHVMKTVLLAATLSTLVVSAAMAQMTIPQKKPLSNERLAMLLFPAGWKNVTTYRGNIEVLDYLPANETVTASRNKITLEVYHDMTTLPLDALYRQMQGQNCGACQGSVEEKFQSGLNNGYASAF